MNHDSRNIRAHYPKKVKTAESNESPVCEACLEIFTGGSDEKLCPDCLKIEQEEYNDRFFDDIEWPDLRRG